MPGNALCKKASPEQIQVALLLEFIRHIEWPNQARFKQINIAVVGVDKAMEGELIHAFKQVKVHGLSLKYQSFNPKIKFNTATIQVLYIGKLGHVYVAPLASQFRRTETLLITNGSDLRREFMLNILYKEGQRLSFEINRSNIVFEHLKIDNDLTLLGGTELDVAELFRETQRGLKGLKSQLLKKEQSLRRLESVLKTSQVTLDKNNQRLAQQQQEMITQRELLQQQKDALQEKNSELSLGHTQLNKLSGELIAAAKLLLDKQHSLKKNQSTLDASVLDLHQKEQKVANLSTIIQQNNQILEQQNTALLDQGVEIDQQTQTISRQRLFLLLGGLAIAGFIFFVSIILKVNQARKRAMLAAENAQHASDEANKAKSLFLAKMSHEIRTPMSGVLGMSALLNELNLSKEQQQCNDVITASGQTLLSVINDILDYSKIEAGKMTLENISFNIESLLWEVMKMFRIQAQEKNLPLMADIALDVPKQVIGDPTRLRQILINLIGNAFKFTEKGEILIVVQPVVNAAPLLQFSVYDTGIGLNDEQQGKLFNAFSQADSSTTRKHGGTGLGLSICKQLAELMGGSIHLSSEKGQGSHFWVELALKADNKPLLHEKTAKEKLQGRKIILIDDNVTYRNLLKKFCHRVGIDVFTFPSANEALEHMQAHYKTSSSYDLLISDLNMPQMSGLQLAHKLFTMPRFNKLPMVLMTASAIPPRAEELQNTHIIKAVEKPLVEREFIALLDDVFSHHSKPDQTDGHGDQQINTMIAKLTQPLHILVAEDNAVIRAVMKGILKKCQQKADYADNGLKALKWVQQAEQDYDVIFMDCEMPEMDGLTACKEIRLWEKAQHKPAVKIIALTAHVLPEQVVKCKESGMDEFMIKPVDVTTLYHMLIHITEQKYAQ